MSDYEQEQYDEFEIKNIPLFKPSPVGENVGKSPEELKNVITGAQSSSGLLDVSKALTVGAAIGAEESFDAAADFFGAAGDLYGYTMKSLGVMDEDTNVVGGSDSIKSAINSANEFYKNHLGGAEVDKFLNEQLEFEPTILNNIAKVIGQFGITAVPAATIVKSLTTANAVTRGFLWGGIADFASFNPNDETLAVMLTEYLDGATPEERTAFGNVIVNALRKNESDPDIFNRMKSMVDGGVAGGAMEGVVQALIYTAKKVPWQQMMQKIGTDAQSRLDQGGTTLSALGIGEVEKGIDQILANLAPKQEGNIVINRLSNLENKLVKDAATKNNKVSNAIYTQGKDEILRVKNNFKTQDGWEPINIHLKSSKPAFKINKEGKVIPNWQLIPWSFNKPKDKRISIENHKKNLINKTYSDIQELAQRAENGDQAAIDIIKQANWYRSMRTKLRQEFGGLGDVYADLLGATSAQTNVRANWDNALEILRQYSRGDFDKEINLYKKRLDAGEKVDTITLHNLDKDVNDPFQLIKDASGKLFNANSPAATGALLDLFRQIKAGKSPKTINYAGNLIGFTEEATIDVWAARYLRKIAGYNRIPPVAQQAVSGKHLTQSTFDNPVIGAEFNFGQEVIKDATALINNDAKVMNIISNVDENISNLNPDDMQAVLWFLEKENWTKNGWTNKAGEAGSLDYESSIAGIADRERVNELRQIIDSKDSTDEARALATKELEEMATPLDRTVVGITRQREETPTNLEMQELSNELTDVISNDESVAAYQANNTYGEFAGEPERALNVEIITNEKFNDIPLKNKVAELGRKYDQDAVFVSKVVSSDTPNALPGVEVYFRSTQGVDFIQKITTLLREKGIDGFTFITDARQSDQINVQALGNTETANLTGFRFQYIPNFDDSFDGTNLAIRSEEMENLFDEVVNDLSQMNEISFANMTYYDTNVYVNRDRPGTEWINGGTSYEEQIGTTIGESQAKGADFRGTTAATTDSGGEIGNVSQTDVSDRIGKTESATSAELNQNIEVTPPSGNTPGVIAYHGSGADFNEFKIEKVASGTGRTFFGHGIYFSSKKDVAEHYKAMRSQDIYDNIGKETEGVGYKVDLDVSDDQLINMAMKLNELPQKAQDVLRKYYDEYDLDENKLVVDLLHKMPNNPLGKNYRKSIILTSELENAGYKGFKDPGNDGMPGTDSKLPNDSMFVIFDDKTIKILEKFGIVGAVSLTPLISNKNNS